ncbi:MAG: hypothetical protein AAFU85_17205 [Planctomycetota bacterium]
MATESKVFESIAEFVDNCTDSALAFEAQSGVKFLGRNMSGDTRRKSQDAYEPGMKLLDECRDEVRDMVPPAPKSRSRRARFDEFDGDDICLDRLRTGAPFWRTSRREETTGPQTVTVVVDLAASASRRAADVAWRGLAAILIAEQLEQSGIRVELWAAAMSEKTYENGDGCSHAIKLKDASAPLDLVAVVNATSGWFLRTFIFASSTVSASGSTIQPHYGIPFAPNVVTASALLGVDVDAVVSDCWDRSACIETIEQVLGRFGAVAA